MLEAIQNIQVYLSTTQLDKPFIFKTFILFLRFLKIQNRVVPLADPLISIVNS